MRAPLENLFRSWTPRRPERGFATVCREADRRERDVARRSDVTLARVIGPLLAPAMLVFMLACFPAGGSGSVPGVGQAGLPLLNDYQSASFMLANFTVEQNALPPKRLEKQLAQGSRVPRGERSLQATNRVTQ